MDINRERIVEFILEWMPYNEEELLKKDYREVFRIQERAEIKQQHKIDQLESQKQ